MSEIIEYFLDEDHEYEVSLMVLEDGGKGCFILYQTRRGSYSASLQCAQDFGVLTCDQDATKEHKISNRILDMIEEWAIENGY